MIDLVAECPERLDDGVGVAFQAMVGFGGFDLEYNRELIAGKAKINGDHAEFGRMELDFQAVNSAGLGAAVRCGLRHGIGSRSSPDRIG